MRSPGLFIDIGETDLFYTELEDTVEYVNIHRSHSSSVFLAVNVDGCKTVLRVSWSVHKRVAQGRGYKGLLMCNSIPQAPEMYSRTLSVVGDTYVEVSTRQYMEGCTLSEAWSSLDPVQRMSVIGQVEAIVEKMSAFTSTHFMSLQGRNLSTTSPVLCLNYRLMLSMITQDLKESDMRVLDMQDFHCPAVLCHGNLSTEHVIVTGSTVTGIVGWSACDYMPETMDRMKYQFARPVHEGESEWYTHISQMYLFHIPPPPLYVASCVYYNYYLRLRSTPECYHQGLAKRLSEICDSIVPSVRETYMGLLPHEYERSGDRGSRARHEAPVRYEEDSVYVREHKRDSQTTALSSTETWEDWDDSGTVLDILGQLGEL
nr:hypothetical protein CFP56_78078 [Quercus suber]